jgi:putative ABC transport system substrate-binding protein
MRSIIVRRREFVTLLGGALAWPLAALAEQPERVRRVGVLTNFAENDPEMPPRFMAFRQGLDKLGWTVGRNLQIDYRWTAGDVERMGAYAAELVGLTPDVMLATNTPTLAALRQATRTIPIVFVQVADPVGSGFVESFARPGGNVTGFVPVEPVLGGKWLSLLKEIAPQVTRVAFMFSPETAPYAAAFLRSAEAAAPLVGVELISAPVHDAAGIEAALAALGRGPGGGFVAMPDSFITIHRERIIELAAQRRFPAVYPYRLFTMGGGLISYGTDPADGFRQVASYVSGILRGAKPADLPVQAQSKIDLVINLKTAKALSLDLPLSLLIRVDEVIE